MKKAALSLLLIVTLAATAFADDATSSTPVPVVPQADPNANSAPGEGFPSRRYETLWTKSPFSVETPEAAEESPDYALVGVAQIDGVFYATLVQRQNQQHFVLTSDKPLNGLSLTSVTRGQNPGDITAAIVKDGQPLTLKLEAAPMTAQPGAQPIFNATTSIPVPQPGVIQQNIQMPGTSQPIGNGPIRPLIRIHRSTIHLPQRIEQPPPTPNPPPPPPAQ